MAIAPHHSTTSDLRQWKEYATVTFTTHPKRKHLDDQGMVVLLLLILPHHIQKEEIMVTKSLRPSHRGEGDWQCPLTIPSPFLLHRGRGKLVSDLHHILDGEVKGSKGPSLLFLQKGQCQ